MLINGYLNDLPVDLHKPLSAELMRRRLVCFEDGRYTIKCVIVIRSAGGFAVKWQFELLGVEEIANAEWKADWRPQGHLKQIAITTDRSP